MNCFARDRGESLDREQSIKYWYSQYSNDIYNYLVYYTGNIDVEDLVQEVFIKAINNFEQYKGNSKPKTWLITIARNTAIDYKRRQRLKKWLPSELLNKFATNDNTPSQTLEIKEDMNHFYYLLKKLNKNYRDVLLLRIVQELSVKETAQVLNWNEEKVRLTNYRALMAIRRLHSEKEGGAIGE